MNVAPELNGTAIRDAIRKLQDPNGTVIGTGPEEFKKAVALIKGGKPIRYSGGQARLNSMPTATPTGLH